MSRPRVVTSPERDDEKVLTLNVFLDTDGDFESRRPVYHQNIKNPDLRNTNRQEDLKSDEIQEIKRLIRRMKDSNSKEASPDGYNYHRRSTDYKETPNYYHDQLSGNKNSDFRSPPIPEGPPASNRKFNPSQLDTWGKKEIDSDEHRLSGSRPSKVPTPRSKPNITVTGPPSVSNQRFESKREEPLDSKRRGNNLDDEDSLDHMPPKHVATEHGDPLTSKRTNRNSRLAQETEIIDANYDGDRSDPKSKQKPPSVPRMNLTPVRPALTDKQTLTEDYFEILALRPKHAATLTVAGTQTSERHAQVPTARPPSLRNVGVQVTNYRPPEKDAANSARRSLDSVDRMPPKSVSSFRQERPVPAAAREPSSKKPSKKAKSSASRKSSLTRLGGGPGESKESRPNKSPSRAKVGEVSRRSTVLSKSEMTGRTPQKAPSHRTVPAPAKGEHTPRPKEKEDRRTEKKENSKTPGRKKKVGADRHYGPVLVGDGPNADIHERVHIKPSDSRSRSPPLGETPYSLTVTPLHPVKPAGNLSRPLEREVYDRQHEVIRHLQEEKDVLERMIAKLIYEGNSRSVSKDLVYKSPEFRQTHPADSSMKKSDHTDEMRFPEHRSTENNTFRQKSPDGGLSDQLKPTNVNNHAAGLLADRKPAHVKNQTANRGGSSMTRKEKEAVNKQASFKENIPPQPYSRKGTARKMSPKLRQEESCRRLMRGSPPRCLKFEEDNQRTLNRLHNSPPKGTHASSPPRVHYSPTRPLPFDVDKRLDKTEWELRQPMMTRMERNPYNPHSFGGFPSRPYSIDHRERSYHPHDPYNRHERSDYSVADSQVTTPYRNGGRLTHPDAGFDGYSPNQQPLSRMGGLAVPPSPGRPPADCVYCRHHCDHERPDRQSSPPRSRPQLPPSRRPSYDRYGDHVRVRPSAPY